MVHENTFKPDSQQPYGVLPLTKLWNRGCRLITPFCELCTFVLRKQVSRLWSFSRSSGVWRTKPCCSGNRSISGNIAVDRPLLNWKTINRRQLAHYWRSVSNVVFVRHCDIYLVTVRKYYVGMDDDAAVVPYNVQRTRERDNNWTDPRRMSLLNVTGCTRTCTNLNLNNGRHAITWYPNPSGARATVTTLESDVSRLEPRRR